MDETYTRMLWHAATPEIPAGRARTTLTLDESKARRAAEAAELDRLNATLARNQAVRRRGCPASDSCDVLPVVASGDFDADYTVLARSLPACMHAWSCSQVCTHSEAGIDLTGGCALLQSRC